jgi:uncharacterized protein
VEEYRDTKIKVSIDENNGPVIEFEGNRLAEDSFSGNLYFSDEIANNKVKVRAIPYSDWGNRKPGEMLVWIRES